MAVLDKINNAILTVTRNALSGPAGEVPSTNISMMYPTSSNVNEHAREKNRQHSPHAGPRRNACRAELAGSVNSKYDRWNKYNHATMHTVIDKSGNSTMLLNWV